MIFPMRLVMMLVLRFGVCEVLVISWEIVKIDLMATLALLAVLSRMISGTYSS